MQAGLKFNGCPTLADSRFWAGRSISCIPDSNCNLNRKKKDKIEEFTVSYEEQNNNIGCQRKDARSRSRG